MSTLRSDWLEYIYDQTNKYTSVKYYYSESIHPTKDFHFKLDKKWVSLQDYWLIFCNATPKSAMVLTTPEQVFQIHRDSVLNESYTHCLFIRKDEYTQAEFGLFVQFIFNVHNRVKDIIFDEDFHGFVKNFRKHLLYLIPIGRVEMHFIEKEVNTGHPLKDQLMKLGSFASSLLENYNLGNLYAVTQIFEGDNEFVMNMDYVLYSKEMIVLYEPAKSAYNVFFLKNGEVIRYKKSSTLGKTRLVVTDINIQGNYLGEIDENTKFDSTRIGEVIRFVKCWGSRRFVI